MRRAELMLYLLGIGASGALLFEVPRQLRAPGGLGGVNVVVLLALLALSVGGVIKVRFDRE